jgi:MOSC domain-containing protein YiiM
MSVRTENGHYLGSATVKQQEFGITPITIAGGTVKVKDEVKIEFDIRTSSHKTEGNGRVRFLSDDEEDLLREAIDKRFRSSCRTSSCHFIRA